MCLVFKAVESNDYDILFVNENFLTGAPFNTSQSFLGTDFVPLTRTLQETAVSLQLLDNKECISKYTERLLSGRRHLLLVTDVGKD